MSLAQQANASGSASLGPLTRHALGNQVYERIKARIMDMEVAPGARLNMEQVARDFGVSPIPVREAMARLAAEGLLRGESYRGYTVTPWLIPEEFHSLFAARRLIEGHAAGEGAARGNPGVIADLERLQKVMATHPTGGRYLDYRAFSAADAQFHQTIVGSAGNPWIIDMYRALNAHLHLSRLYPVLPETDRDFAEATAEHARITAAYRRGSGAEARDAVLEHLAQSGARLAPCVARASSAAGQA